MCIYVLSVPLCGHSPTLLFGPSCSAVYAQLNRIVDPAAWQPPALHQLPFRLPEGCLPNERNIAVVRSSNFCGACQADYGYGDRREGQRYGCEAEGAECPLGRWPGLEMYWGPERIGVGWRR